MKYMLLIYGDEREWEALTEQQQAEVYRDYDAYHSALRAAAKTPEGAQLHATRTAKSVRVRDGRRSVTDGPFAETAEQLAGYYLIDCEDLDEALDWAARIPAAAVGTIEVRPLMQTPG